jgi:nicotinamidase-related amidase
VRAPHHVKNIMTTTRPLEILHMALFGPIAYISIDGNKFDLVIIDNYSCFTWVFFLPDKSKTQEVPKKFLKRAQNEFDAKVKKIRSNNGSEFKNTQVEDYLDQEGIKHEFLAPILHNTWVFFLPDKSKTQEVLKKFLKRSQNEFDAKVKKIRSNNGSEFKNTQVKDYLDQEGIKHEFLAPILHNKMG